MNLLSQFSTLGSDLIHYVVPFLLVLSVVVFCHELGHFLVARWCGVKILAFSIGFGPELFGFNDRHGTRWRIAAVPLGGYVRFLGDENAASVPDTSALSGMDAAERAQSLPFQPVYKRAAIVAAGPLANFLLAIALFSGIFMIYGLQTMSAKVDAVQPGSPAAAAGFKPGDLVVAIDGQKVSDFADMQRVVSDSAGRTLAITVKRDGGQIQLHATPILQQNKDVFGNVERVGLLGIRRSPTPSDLKYQPVSPPKALWLATRQTWDIVSQTLGYLGGVVTGHKPANQLSGPIGIARIVGQAATISLGFLLQIAGVISVSIGLINLFPIPLLDGGHLAFYLVEALRGRPLSEKAQEVGFRIGFAIVVMLMLFATFNDIIRLTAS